MPKNKTCGECKHLNKELAFCRACGAKWLNDSDGANCKYFEKTTPPTLFHRITADEETLAKELTYWQYDPDQSRCGWTNNVIVGKLHKNYHEAIAATVEKLKE